MKKILAVLLALLMLFSFVACGGGADTESESESESDTSTEAPGTETQAPDSESESDTETDPVTESESETEPSVEDIFVDRDETVYVNGADALNVRANNKIDANNVVGTLKVGESVKRIAYNETWSKIIYNGKEYFASSKYLSTKAPVAFDEVNETVYVKIENTVTVRAMPWAEAEALAYLPNNTVVTRTGIAKEADEFGSSWSRINYTDDKGNAKEGYVNSKFLTTETPIAFTEVNETVYITNCETLNLRAEASLSGKTLASLKSGTELQRIGVANTLDDEGILWSMLMHEGTVCYASSAYLAKKTDPKVFTAAGMSITLDDSFEAVSDAELALTPYAAGFDSENIAITVTKELPADLEAAGLSANLSVEGYANIIITLYGLNTTVATQNNVTYFTYNSAMTDGTIITIFAATYKSADAYWLIQFLTTPDVYPAVKANIMNYATSVSFN